jgi:hypothetical protein
MSAGKQPHVDHCQAIPGALLEKSIHFSLTGRSASVHCIRDGIKAQTLILRNSKLSPMLCHNRNKNGRLIFLPDPIETTQPADAPGTLRSAPAHTPNDAKHF